MLSSQSNLNDFIKSINDATTKYSQEKSYFLKEIETLRLKNTQLLAIKDKLENSLETLRLENTQLLATKDKLENSLEILETKFSFLNERESLKKTQNENNTEITNSNLIQLNKEKEILVRQINSLKEQNEKYQINEDINLEKIRVLMKEVKSLKQEIANLCHIENEKVYIISKPKHYLDETETQKETISKSEPDILNANKQLKENSAVMGDVLNEVVASENNEPIILEVEHLPGPIASDCNSTIDVDAEIAKQLELEKEYNIIEENRKYIIIETFSGQKVIISKLNSKQYNLVKNYAYEYQIPNKTNFIETINYSKLFGKHIGYWKDNIKLILI